MLRGFAWPSRSSDLSTKALRTLAFMLATIMVALIGVDAIWIYVGHFSVDLRSYALFALLLAPLMTVAITYTLIWPQPLVGPTCVTSAFLLAFSPSCVLLSYLLSTIAGTRIDNLLAQIDHAIGFNWVGMMVFAADHKFITTFLGLAYASVMPQIMLLATILGWSGKTKALYGLCLSIAAGALICVLLWTLHPSFGAFSVFDLPRATATKLSFAPDEDHKRYLVDLLKNGPGFLTPLKLRSIIGFPSFHTIQAMVLIWYTRKLPVIRWISLALNALVLVATPIYGGDHLIDLFGGVAVAIVAILLSDWAARTVNRSHGVPNFHGSASPAGAGVR